MKAFHSWILTSPKAGNPDSAAGPGCWHQAGHTVRNSDNFRKAVRIIFCLSEILEENSDNGDCQNFIFQILTAFYI